MFHCLLKSLCFGELIIPCHFLLCARLVRFFYGSTHAENLFPSEDERKKSSNMKASDCIWIVTLAILWRAINSFVMGRSLTHVIALRYAVGDILFLLCYYHKWNMSHKDSQGNALDVETKTNLKFEAQICLASTQNYFLWEGPMERRVKP